MTFLIVYISVLIAPGMIWARVLGFENGRVCVSIALSISILVAALASARVGGLGSTGLGIILLILYGGTLAIALRGWTATGPVWRQSFQLHPTYVVPVFVSLSVLGYMFWAGAYLEVPADAWWHIGRINDAREALSSGHIDSTSFYQLMEKDNYYWHTVTAYALHFTGVQVEPALPYLALANTALFCAGVYSFAFLVFMQLEEDLWKRHFMAGATVLFFVTHFGIDVFSYVRYYVFAPALLNYIVYLGALVCLFEFLHRSQRLFRCVGVGMLMVLVAALVHYQEMIFIVLMGGAVLLVEALRYLAATRNPSREARITTDDLKGSVGRKALILLGVLVFGYVATHATVYLTVERENPMTYGLMADIHNYLPFLRNLYVLRPTGQFYQVITVWGVMVYVLFLFRRKFFLQSSYLVAGMAMPVLTVFNPVFTDFFLRFASPEVLWRMCYMIPLPLVGGYFLVRGVERSIVAGPVFGRLQGIAVVLGLIVLLLPIKTVYFNAPHSKIYTLAPVSQGNSYRLWGDLLAFLKDRGYSRVITDQVTGYIINGVTHHKYRGYKFYSKYAFHIGLDDYDEDFRQEGGWKRLVRYRDFEARDQWLVVVNRRDGNLSETGLHSGHWPEDIMHLSKQYSESFLQYIEEEQKMFPRIWVSDDKLIEVYRVENT